MRSADGPHGPEKVGSAEKPIGKCPSEQTKIMNQMNHKGRTMKRTTLYTEKPGGTRGCQWVAQVSVSLMLMLSLLSLPVRADQNNGCHPAMSSENPLCFYDSEIGECSKAVEDPTAGYCASTDGNFVCWTFDRWGTLTLYSHAGNSQADCGCDSSGWVQVEDPIGDYYLPQAYNNDTECYGG